jgi:hypothetical protein
MMGRLLTAFLAVSFAAGLGSAASAAKPCHDAKGKFMKCKTTMAMPMKKPCRDAKGKFMKCKSTKM